MKNLDTAVTAQLSPSLTGPGQTVFGSVAIAGDTVAWNISLCSIVAGSTECFGQLLSYRNIATMGAVQTIPSAGPQQIALSPEYLAYNTYNPATSKWDLYVNPLYTSTVTDIAQLTDPFYRQFSISGSTIGWLGTDELAHVQALTHIAERPRDLGNGIAPSSLVADGTHTWNGDFVASTNLTTCTVTIKSGSTTVRRCHVTQVRHRLARPLSAGTPRTLAALSSPQAVHVDIDRRERRWHFAGRRRWLDPDHRHDRGHGSDNRRRRWRRRRAVAAAAAVAAVLAAGAVRGSATADVDRLSGADRFATADRGVASRSSRRAVRVRWCSPAPTTTPTLWWADRWPRRRTRPCSSQPVQRCLPRQRQS